MRLLLSLGSRLNLQASPLEVVVVVMAVVEAALMAHVGVVDVLDAWRLSCPWRQGRWPRQSWWKERRWQGQGKGERHPSPRRVG